LDIKTGEVTEYDIPTGPLATVVYIASPQNEKIWFTEVLANKIGYLDTSIPVPIRVTTTQSAITVQQDNTKYLDVFIEKDGTQSPILLNDIQISLAGMTHSGIEDISYEIVPQTVDLNKIEKAQSRIGILAQDTAKSGLYNIMLQITAKERSDEELKVSILRPIDVSMDIGDANKMQSPIQSGRSDAASQTTLKDIIQTVALAVAAALSALIILRRIRLRISKKR